MNINININIIIVLNVSRAKLSYFFALRYEGEFRDNHRQGKGKITFISGDIYEGKNSQIIYYYYQPDELPHLYIPSQFYLTQSLHVFIIPVVFLQYNYIRRMEH